MKKLLLIILCGCLSMVSCDDQLDLADPQGVDQDLALSTSDNVTRVLRGVYDELSSASLFGGNILRNAELMASNGEIRWQGTFQGPRELFNKEITVVNADVTAFWLVAYSTINIANNVLAALEVVDEDIKDRVQGEALFIRGLVYFELTKFFGKPYGAGNTSSNLGVPLVLTPTRGITSESYVSRASVADCYQQILADLTSAESLLPNTNGAYATKGAAAALLSRVYLQMENFAQARDAANRVISSGLYSLTSTYSGAFNTSTYTSEDIFSTVVTAQDGTNSMVTFFLSQSSGGRGDIPVLQPHLDLYETDDDRLDFFFFEDGDWWTGKFTTLVANNVKVIRLAEMYLTRAEANFRLETSVGATPLNDINTIRDRSNASTLETVDLNDILLERRMELAFEGHRVHDIKRNKLSADGFAYDANELVFPIPQREMNVNPNLVQNSGYN